MSFVFNELTNHCHINIVTSVPNYKVKNRLNFRIHSVEMKDGKIVRDPTFADSVYVFPIKNALVGKKIQFSFSFLKPEIENVKKFKIGFCDEMVRWLDSTILTFENTLFQDSDISTKAEEAKIQIDSVEVSVEVDVQDLQVLTASEVSAILESDVLVSGEGIATETLESSELEVEVSTESLQQELVDIQVSDEQLLGAETTSDLSDQTSPTTVQSEKVSVTTSRKQRRNKRK